jgi:hypothetical protein
MYHLSNVLHFAETVYVCISYSHHNFRTCLRPLTSSFSFYYIFIFILLLPERRRGEAWEPSKKMMLLLPHPAPHHPQHKSVSSYCLAFHFFTLLVFTRSAGKDPPSPPRKERKHLLLLSESGIYTSLSLSVFGRLTLSREWSLTTRFYKLKFCVTFAV